ncbi:MAG: hypothetical protein K9H61_05720 [Bacteroidia bacterium]|nr:hypothetical protein [Bacteroidia bacterium]MCF8427031.1 hypothetical protein [Bacteroidia bacterium]MCF8446475.1 hypothetical protein [Bacteroidia bacterium]
MKKAVITGDIIQSTKMKSNERKMLIDEVDAALKLLSKDYNMQYELYRGDSFQCLLPHPENALRVALLIKTFIKHLNPSEAFELKSKENPLKNQSMIYPVWMFDTRIAIGIGEGEEEIESLGKANGEAFLFSGRTLDNLKGSKQSIGIATDDNYQLELETECNLLDSIIARNSALQCEVIYLKLLGYTEIQIAKRLNIAQSAVNQRSNNGSWNAIHTMVLRYETIYQELES